MTEDEWLAGLVDTLLPGGNGFPAAGATGMMNLLALRLRQEDVATLPRLAGWLGSRAAPPADPAAWQEAARTLEALEPRLFDAIRKYAYLTYYEQPAVIDAIRALGLRYNHAPLPEGYPTDPFVPEHDAPRHTRGHWLRTEEVVPVDLAALAPEPLR